MSDLDVEITLRGPEGYDLARMALEDMERVRVWPTPRNFELWLHYLGDPEGPLGQEIQRLLASGEPINEEISESLASAFLARGRLTDEIRDAGAQLSKELKAVATSISTAQKSQKRFGETLAGASEGFGRHGEGAPELKKLVSTLATATTKVQEVTTTLEQRLQASRTEVIKLREHLEQVRRDASTDALTNLANRKAFDEHFQRVIDDADAHGKQLTLAMVDIDHFKRFNDTWGHQTGDQVLRYVASVIARVTVAPRLAARYGGEEFALLFPGEASTLVEAAMNKVREEIATRQLRRRSTNEDLGMVTISVGIAQRHTDETTMALMERADGALYTSKRSGRNRVTNAERMEKAA
jgi:diguanylate cyclase